MCVGFISCVDSETTPEKTEEKVITPEKETSEVNEEIKNEEKDVDAIDIKKATAKVNSDDKDIKESKLAMNPEDMAALAPDKFGHYKRLPASSTFRRADDGSPITIATVQFYMSRPRSYIKITFIDYFSEKNVDRLPSYDELPDMPNNKTKHYNGKHEFPGHVTWNSLTNDGWVEILVHQRYVVTVRAHGPNASKEQCVEMLDMMDVTKLKKN